MTTDTVYRPITISDVVPIGEGKYAEDSLNAIRSGLSDAIADSGMEPLVRALHASDDHPGVMAFEREIADQVAAELAPAVAEMLTAAIRRRLPWTWEPER